MPDPEKKRITFTFEMPGDIALGFEDQILEYIEEMWDGEVVCLPREA